MNKKNFLLSPQFREDLEKIKNIYFCAISAALLAADNKVDHDSPYNYLGVKYSEEDEIDNEKLKICFLPKGKSLVYDEYGNVTKKYIQKGKPSKIAFSVLERTTTKSYAIYNGEKYNFLHDSIALIGKVILWKDGSICDMTKHIKLTEEEFSTLDIVREKVKVQPYTESEYEKFANNLKSYYSCKLEFELVSGQDIAKYYHCDTYYEESGYLGTLWDSCMRDMPEETFNIYTQNPVCRMLVALHCGQLVGRALVWETDKGILMDRIYSYWDYLVLDYEKYAKERKWHYKSYQSSSIGPFNYYDKTKDCYVEREHMTFSVKLTYIDDYAPYLDTLKYIHCPTKTLSNGNDLPFTHILEATDGYMNEDVVECIVTGDRIHMDDAVYVESEDGYTYSEYVEYDYNGTAILERDSIRLYDGRIAHENDENVVDLHDSSYSALISDCHYIDRFDAWVLKSNAVELYNGEYALLNDDVVEIKPGVYAYADDSTLDEITD